MKTILPYALTGIFAAASLSLSTVHAQILRVDSVTVDSVWNSDTTWNGAGGVLQKRQSRDCRIRFVPQGEGRARMFIALSVDSTATWTLLSDSLSVLNKALDSTFAAGSKATIRVRLLGGDRNGVAFNLTARTAAPGLTGILKTVPLGLTGALTAGQGVDALIRVRLGGTAAVDGFCSLAKVFWDASGDGTIDDSTSGANVSTWIWHTVVPPVTEGIRPAVIARAIDKNNVWSAPETLLVKFGMQRPIVMKDIPAGTFSMGEAGVADSVHQVTLRAFRIQETEVTQEQYLAVMGKNPSYFPGDFSRPVEQANWNDAVQFCNELSALTGLTPVYDTATLTPDNTKTGYRLPTEAQWEYACRAGSTTPYWWAADTNGLGASAWWYGNSSGTTHPVASKSANGWGLFDMAGNVLEWCNDWYAGYAPGAATDPTGASSGTYRVIRGGCLADMSARLRSASRLKGIPGYRPVGPGYAGFRVALPPQ